MDEITRQVDRARRRLILQRVNRIVPWTCFGALLVAAAAIAIPKIWVLESLATPLASTIWSLAWLGGAVLVGLLAATAVTYFTRARTIDAAIEIDRRYGLKERVSSAFSLTPEELESEAGRALIDDAGRRVSRIDVREQFGFGVNWRALMPLIPAVLAFVLIVFVSDATQNDGKGTAAASKVDVKKQVQTAEDAFKQKLEQQRKKLTENERLKDAADFFKRLEDRLGKDGDKEKADRKSSLVRLNDIKKEIEDRKKQLGDGDAMKKQLNDLKDLKKGPADKAVDAIKGGDFKKAMDELKKLSDKIKDGKLTDEERKELQQQLNQLQQKLDEHEQAKKELEEQIKKAQESGDQAKAQQLQQQLDRLQQKDQAMQGLKDFAQKLGQCADCLKNGDNQGASQQLDQLAQQLQQLQDELDEMQTLDAAMDQIAQAKNAMNCQECNGQGCKACQGQGLNGMFGQGDNPMQQAGTGLGAGQGRGERPEQETDTGHYLSQVRGEPKPGEAVRTGTADGPNLAGKTREEVKQAAESALKQDTDPLTDQRLPKPHRDHARQYFEKFREGE